MYRKMLIFTASRYQYCRGSRFWHAEILIAVSRSAAVQDIELRCPTQDKALY